MPVLPKKTPNFEAAKPAAPDPGALDDLPRKRRKKRSAEIRNSLRLGLVLVGLVGINVYIFFFNRGTAPREVLKPASTVNSTDAQKQGLLQQSADAVGRPAAKTVAMATPPARRAAGRAASAPARPAAGAAPVAGAVPQPAAPAGVAASSAAAPAVPRPVVQIPFALPEDDATEDKRIGASDTLGQLLAREGFGSSTTAVVAALSKLCDPKLIRGGQIYRVGLDDDGAPASFEYQPTPILRYVVEKDDGGVWKGRKLEQAVDVRTVQATGVVDSSLYDSVKKSGESTVLVSLLVELFAWDVNFYVDTNPGDHWKVVVEKQFLGGQFYRYGRILAAEYGGRVGTFRAFFWKAPGSKSDGRYYDERGQAITKTMLKTPLRYVRISSKFDRKRFHPILHVEKAHLGIDYAAPVGTPVWASASGRVVECEMKRGSGNTVVIAHANGLSTRYYHLSRFARGLHPGQAVKQKDVIGFVGTTGLSTGPHLHFSVTKNGAFVDPSKLQVSRDAPVAERAAFLDAIRPRIAALKGMQPAALAKN